MATPSGAYWVSQFPGQATTDSLEPQFRARFLDFQSAMENSGIQVTISAAFRPPERAYMMHWSWMIVRNQVDPADVPAYPGVDIVWNHADAVAGAQEMVDGFGINHISVAPALHSRHTEGKAVDTNLSWTGDIQILDGNNNVASIKGPPRNATHPDLIKVGATYLVYHFSPSSADPYHWSSDGH